MYIYVHIYTYICVYIYIHIYIKYIYTTYIFGLLYIYIFFVCFHHRVSYIALYIRYLIHVLFWIQWQQFLTAHLSWIVIIWGLLGNQLYPILYFIVSHLRAVRHAFPSFKLLGFLPYGMKQINIWWTKHEHRSNSCIILNSLRCQRTTCWLAYLCNWKVGFLLYSFWRL